MAMVAIKPSDVARRWLKKLAVPGALPPRSYHVTLLYVPGELSKHDTFDLVEAVRRVCSRQRRFVARIAGFGHFADSKPKPCVWAAVDAEPLAALRTSLVQELENRSSIKLPKEHGLTPHLTLGYSHDARKWHAPKDAEKDLPEWSVDDLYVVQDDVWIAVPLAPARGDGTNDRPYLHDMDGLNKFWKGAAPLVIADDIVKGRKKGSQNKIRQYLLRIPTGRESPPYWYIRPDEEDVESFDLKTGYKLKPGKSAAKIISEKLFGDYGVDSRTGKPWVKPGLFYDYEAKISTAYMQRKYGEPIDTDKLNKIRFFKYKKVHGYAGDIDLGPGLKASGYRLPEKRLADLQISEEEAAARAPGAVIAEGAKPQKKPPRDVPTDVVPAGETSIHAVPPPSTLTQRHLDEPLPDDADPLRYAVAAIEGLRPEPGKAVVRPFKSWQVEKFEGGMPQLVDELSRRPATTLVTLGKFKPTQRKVVARLADEWLGVIRGKAKNAVAAYRVSEDYQAAKASDDAAGRSYESRDSAARSFMRDVFQETVAHGNELLLKLARKYDPNEHSRFDKWLSGALDSELAAFTKKEVEERRGGSIEPILERFADENEAAHRTAQQIELSPEDVMELKQTGHAQFSPGDFGDIPTLREMTAPAKATLLRVLHSQDMPQAYRRVFAARLWLDSPESSSEEAESIAKRQRVGQAQPGMFERRYTGKGGIASKYKTWQDPETGEIINIDRLSQSRQAKLLGKWYDAATASIFRQLSVPLHEARADMPETHRAALYQNPKRVPFTPEQLHAKLYAAGHGLMTTEQVADFMVDTALGGGVRVLTKEGAMVKRWLELEAKLARGNRRLYVERTQHPVKKESLTRPAMPKTDKLVVLPQEPVRTKTGAWASLPVAWEQHAHPAVAFFSQTENQKLAQRLGVSLRNLRGDHSAGGVYAAPHVSMGTAAEHALSAATHAHEKLQKLQKLSGSKFAARVDQAKGAVAALTAMGFVHGDGGVKLAEDSLLHKYHNAARELAKHTTTLKQKESKVRAAKKAYQHTANTVTVAEKNPFDRKKDKLAHQVMRYVLEAKPRTTRELDRAILTWADAHFDFDKPATRRAQLNDTKEYLRKHKVLRAGGDVAQHEAEIRSHEPTLWERAAHQEAVQDAAQLGAKLDKLRAGDRHIGREAALAYVGKRHPDEVFEELSRNLRQAAVDAHTDLALAEFEAERRKAAGKHGIVKSFEDAGFAAFRAVLDACESAYNELNALREVSLVAV